jgi:hypothetical protein
MCHRSVKRRKTLRKHCVSQHFMGCFRTLSDDDFYNHLIISVQQNSEIQALFSAGDLPVRLRALNFEV